MFTMELQVAKENTRHVKKSCFYCGGSASCIGIIERNGVKVVEGYCDQHAKTHGPIPQVKLKVVN